MFTRKHTRTPEASDLHDVLDVPMFSELPDGSATLYVAMGCFWGAERIFWKIPGVVTTAVGYMGGHATEPTYEDVCGGGTGHTETVMVAYDPSRVSERELLKAFWENHDPTTANRQGNDVGTQYRSAIYWTTPQQERAARETSALFQEALDDAGRGAITTEMRPADEAGPFWPAELYHQQYLSKHPGGYCNHGFKGVTCPVGVADLPAQTDVLPPR
ncbi:peptide-methionine (S)-S-oxide reductase MsrA [Dermacoccus nishinomiyaensis]|uniref:Peptide methionine sulfoxide reductase MsrA n=2 Tax=Micrococcales TaxID=85006 RepID=A0A075JGR4_9MICO|nr:MULTISPECIES: peptide-methionine (S)-S-oxide reductase MsrA [Dermacoccus]AIF41401.1 peptide methionine sulfoxide reductase [Dermacoccus nishinomiyaensis]EFP58920.1 peptide-methionine (S)-S-oxide reductase [Dermacoccus sp. Ellin185]MBO1759071.1 peptide-methionine (S)-S-oxide reductase MsrA [Dermacoccus sp. NHGro5]MCG7430739.1 peptide-methionine (S)-S-oxide reductase MsrA [Dermacoccus nishinomiyaensis]MCT1604199.1 peptide-methionine (S)-S-oxide reductase MsrA [Dermacoccus nishinomiyaensis]